MIISAPFLLLALIWGSYIAIITGIVVWIVNMNKQNKKAPENHLTGAKQHTTY